MGFFSHSNVPKNQLERVLKVHEDIGAQNIEVKESKRQKGHYHVNSVIVDQASEREQPIIPVHLGE